jgi:glycosyltransferase involved in cell wall biosynthesis
MSLAPVILFCYNRPEHTRKTLRSLKQNHLADQSMLIIYVDGPKAEATDEQKNKIVQVKKVIREEQWCKDVFILESDTNKGLASSVMQGVTQTLDKYGKAIVLEDDHLSDVWFLKFMNDALATYEDDTDVACISGYIYPVKEILPATFFLKGADCWGWATWKRSWELLRTDGKQLLKELEDQNLTSDFNFYNSYPYIPMLKDQIEKKNNSWAILWYASAYLENKYTLYPGKSLIHNTGIDGSGIHSGTGSEFDVVLENKEVQVVKQPVKENKEAKKIIAAYFGNIHNPKKQSLLKRFIKRFIN